MLQMQDALLVPRCAGRSGSGRLARKHRPSTERQRGQCRGGGCGRNKLAAWHTRRHIRRSLDIKRQKFSWKCPETREAAAEIKIVRWNLSVIDQAVMDGVKSKFQTVGNTELVENVVQMVLHSLLRNKQL